MNIGVLGNPLLCYPCTLHQDKTLLLWCDERRRVGRHYTVLPPYTASRINAACFSAIIVGVLGDPLLF